VAVKTSFILYIIIEIIDFIGKFIDVKISKKLYSGLAVTGSKLLVDHGETYDRSMGTLPCTGNWVMRCISTFNFLRFVLLWDSVQFLSVQWS